MDATNANSGFSEGLGRHGGCRHVGDDNPFSPHPALGIPFEVTSDPAGDGFTSLSNADAQMVDSLPSAGTTWLGRPQAGLSNKVRAIGELLSTLLAWKQTILPQLGKTRYVEGETPVVFAWYLTARAVLLWNLTE